MNATMENEYHQIEMQRVQLQNPENGLNLNFSRLLMKSSEALGAGL